MLILLLFTTLSLDYWLLKSLLVGFFCRLGGCQDGVDLLVDFASLWGLLGVSFGSIFRFIFVLIFWGVKKSRGPRREPPGAAGTEPARPLENIFQERRIVNVSCISNTPLVPVGTVADMYWPPGAADWEFWLYSVGFLA